MRAKPHQPRHLQSRHLLLGGAALTAGMQFIVTDALANPAGLSVAAGSATAQTSGSKLTVTTGGNNTVLNWQSFNIAAGETTVFNLPSAGSMVVNNIHDANASQIYGSLQANGLVILMNQHGFYFGPNSFVSVGGLVLTTANCTPPQNTGGSWEFNGPPPLASIVNYGQIKTAAGGSLFLIADEVDNHGTLEAPGGSIGLAAGQTVMLTERPDGRGMSMAVTLPQGSVNNYGDVIADGGTLALNAQVVNQNGLLQANSVREVNGQIELVGSDAVNLGAASQISAQGDSSAGGSAGGDVTVRSGGTFSDAAGSQIVSAGGANGGNGGTIEVSAPEVLSLASTINAGAQNGGNDGTFLLDPANIILSTSASISGSSNPAGSGTISETGAAGFFNVNVNTAFTSVIGNITLDATGNIYVGNGSISGGNFTLAANSGTSWNLSASTKQSGGLPVDTAGTLTLEAGGNINFGNGSSIFDTHNWNITLEAGYNGSGVAPVFTGTGLLSTTAGNINIAAGSLSTSAGAISLTAGNNITVSFVKVSGTYTYGFVHTTGGGSIYAKAEDGNLSAGQSPVGYTMPTSTGSITSLSAINVGGISTEAGGDVTLIAGGSVQSPMPLEGATSSTALTAGAGAYGSGDVTVIAGGDVNGNYVVANGTGNIYAGVTFINNQPEANLAGTGYVLKPAQTEQSGLDPGSAGGTAGLITGPNTAGLALTLISGGWNVAAAQDINLQEVRNPNGDFNQFGGSTSPYLFNYSAKAFVHLSAGNEVQLGADASMPSTTLNPAMEVIYPPVLNISAGAGGVVLGSSSAPASLTLYPSSDGSLTIDTTGPLLSNVGTGEQFTLTVSDAPSLPFSQFSQITDAATPVHLSKPTPIYLNIGGDMDLINLTVPEAAYLKVGGNLIDSSFQGMNLSAAPGSSTTVMEANGDTMSIPVNPGVTTIDVTGDILYPSNYDPVTGAIKTSYNGLALAGGGAFNITARTIDLGTSGGIESQGVVYNAAENYPLAQLFGNGGAFTKGADVTVTTTGNHTEPNASSGDLAGDMDMTLSSIDSLFGGNITINANADLNAGQPNLNVNSQGVRGIYTSSGGDLNITAKGNINVFGSRLTTFDGGNITVESLDGDINAGSGSSSPVSVSGYYETTTAKVTTTTTTTTDSITVTTTTESLATGISTTTTTTTPTVNGTPGTATVTSYDYRIYTDSAQIPFSGIAALTFPDRKQDNYPAPPAVIGNILVEAPNGTAGIGIPGDADYVAPGPASVLANSAGILQLPINKIKYPDAQVLVLAGYELQDGSGHRLTAADITTGTPVLVAPEQYISVGGSGVIASNAKLEASGGISGLIFAFNNINIVAQQNVNVTALGEGNVNVSSSAGTISGTIIGVGSVSVGGGASVDASLISANVSGSSSGQTGLGAGTAAAGTATAAASDETTKAATATLSNNTGDSDDSKKKGKHIALAQKVSRVTVILPGKK